MAQCLAAFMKLIGRRTFIALFALVSVLSSVADPAPVWRQLPVVPGGTSGPRHDDVQFIDAQNGWVSQNANIYHTTNGGITWTTNFTKVGAHFFQQSVTFLTPQCWFRRQPRQRLLRRGRDRHQRPLPHVQRRSILGGGSRSRRSRHERFLRDECFGLATHLWRRTRAWSGFFCEERRWRHELDNR